MKCFHYSISLLLILCCTLSYAEENTYTVVNERPVPLNLSSDAFKHEGLIPDLYTCDGQHHSPPLTIKGVTKKAQSLVLLAVDKESSTPPDQAVIWLVYNIPPQTKTIEANKLPSQAVIGRNDDGSFAYQSPCPKEGTHHYYFNLYALDTVLPETVISLEDASSYINKHLVGYASLMGAYARK